jgi:catechol-2,3-dioxygenase
LIAVRKIGYVTLETPNLARLVEHYVQVVGLILTDHSGGRAILSTYAGERVLTIEEGPASRCKGLSFQVDATVAARDIEKALSSLGVKCSLQTNPAPGIAELVKFKDPAGTTIELFPATIAKDWQSPAAGMAPFKLGHAAFHVADAQSIVKFYTECLGFRVSDWLGDTFAFLRCGQDHHTVNFLAGEHSGIHHMAFELRDANHLLTACDALARNDIRIIWGPGRHAIGHNVFVYHRDPDDYIVEFFAEMDRMSDESLGYFDPRPWHKDKPQRPKVWQRGPDTLIWGTPPTPDFLRPRRTSH